jgi:hypothetical protein
MGRQVSLSIAEKRQSLSEMPNDCNRGFPSLTQLKAAALPHKRTDTDKCTMRKIVVGIVNCSSKLETSLGIPL